MTHAENELLKEVHTVPDGEFSGTKFYCLKNIKKISGQRGAAALKAGRFASMKIDETTLKVLLDEHYIAAKTFDIEKCFAIVYEIRNRMKLITEERSILDLVCIYFFIEGEDINEASDEMNEKKKKIIASNEITRGFFLRTGLNLIENLNEQDEQSLITYLAETRELYERVTRLVSPENLKRLKSIGTT